LWFIVVYLLLVALSPVTIALHVRFGVMVPAVLVAASVAVDTLRFWASIPLFGWLNVVVVWLLPHQIGYFYADGSLRRWSWRAAAGTCSTGLLSLVLLTTVGPYPRSIGGITGEHMSNMVPPTLVVVALSTWLIGLALVCAPLVRRAYRRTWVVAATAKINSVAMSLYLWHMTALLLVVVIFTPMGLAEREPFETAWWVQRPLWIGLGVVVLVVLVRLVGWVEWSRSSRARAATRPTAVAVQHDPLPGRWLSRARRQVPTLD
jgi:hypothetical protein